jgi:hypothetical protein
MEHHDNNGQTPLCMASQEGHFKTVQHLLDHSANIEHEDHEGRTPLEYALLRDGGGPDIVHLLVQAAGQQGNVSLLQNTLSSYHNRRSKRRRIGDMELGN